MGTFARVVLAKKKSTDKHYAIKILAKKTMLNMGAVEHCRNEKNILLAIKHRFVIKMKYYFSDNSYLYFVLPFIWGGELYMLLKRVEHFNEPQSKIYATQVCLALEYLNTLKVVHRDIKPESILIDNIGYIKLADFGFCKLVPGRTYTFCGTPEYIAPEIVLNKGYGLSVDSWSFGILIYEMNAGFPPFRHSNRLILYEKIVSGISKCPPNFSNSLVLLNNILRVDLTRRYGNLAKGANDIKNHSWFKDINWLNILNKFTEAPYNPNAKGVFDGRNFRKFERTVIKASSENLYKREFEDF